jgi:aryl carrier-like protein
MEEKTAVDGISCEHRAVQLAEIETVVAEIWRRALCLEELRPQDSFFELGGDSILMMTVLNRVSGEFGVDLDEGVLLDAPTLSEFCAMIADTRARSTQGEEFI